MARYFVPTLYISDDHGVDWKRVGNLTSMIRGYPTGISFRSSDVGWISCSVRGEERIQFYRTKDGGRTWSEQPLPWETWIPKSPLPEEVKSPPIAGINFLEMNGWALSTDGSTLYTINDINKG